MKKIILASGSKRRSQILKSCGISHIILPSGAEELHRDAKRPGRLVVLNAERKAKSVAGSSGRGIIIGVDTLVLFNGKLVGKPRDKGAAKEMLTAFSGRRITVYSGLCVIDAESSRAASGSDKTLLRVKKIPRGDIDKIFKLLGPCDKAGGFSIEGIGSLIFDDITGSYFNVLGLPMGKLQELFRRIGADLLDYISK